MHPSQSLHTREPHPASCQRLSLRLRNTDESAAANTMSEPASIWLTEAAKQAGLPEMRGYCTIHECSASARLLCKSACMHAVLCSILRQVFDDWHQAERGPYHLTTAQGCARAVSRMHLTCTWLHRSHLTGTRALRPAAQQRLRRQTPAKPPAAAPLPCPTARSSCLQETSFRQHVQWYAVRHPRPGLLSNIKHKGQ